MTDDEFLITIESLQDQLTSLKRRYNFVKDIVFSHPETCRDYCEQVYPQGDVDELKGNDEGGGDYDE